MSDLALNHFFLLEDTDLPFITSSPAHTGASFNPLKFLEKDFAMSMNLIFVAFQLKVLHSCDRVQ